MNTDSVGTFKNIKDKWMPSGAFVLANNRQLIYVRSNKVAIFSIEEIQDMFYDIYDAMVKSRYRTDKNSL